jgi:hypothetical protein
MTRQGGLFAFPVMGTVVQPRFTRPPQIPTNNREGGSLHSQATSRTTLPFTPALWSGRFPPDPNAALGAIDILLPAGASGYTLYQPNRRRKPGCTGKLCANCRASRVIPGPPL